MPLVCATSRKWMVSLALAPLPPARALRTRTAAMAAMNARVTMRRFTTSTISAGSVVGLVRPLGLDHDHAVRPARPVDRRGRQILERSEEHTSELQSLTNLVCRLLLEKKKTALTTTIMTTTMRPA